MFIPCHVICGKSTVGRTETGTRGYRRHHILLIIIVDNHYSDDCRGICTRKRRPHTVLGIQCNT